MQGSRYAVSAICLALLLIQMSSAASASTPSYAAQGAFASYTLQGGFIPYFSGVAGNITYTVSDIYANGSMLLHVFENITAGTDLNPFITTLNITDSIQAPKTFPAVPISNLSSRHVEFQNTSATFLQNSTVAVPAGSFTTMEFSGIGPNGTTVHFWFDGITGLMVEENSGTSAVELESSNIAVPTGPSGLIGGELSYELVFIGAFALGGGGFLYLRHHYTSIAQKKKLPEDAPKS